jgi:steroid delta-isomerase-like uncharacterized protein
MERQTPIRAAFVIGLALAMTGFVSACSSSKELPSPNAKPNTQLGFAQWYQDCWGDFNAKKWDLFKKCYAPNATSQQPGYGKLSASGADEIIKSSQDFAKTFPDGRGEALLILVNGSRITSIYLLKGTNSGPLFAPNGQTIPPTNKKLGMFMAHSIEVNPEGQVVKEIGVMDGITLESQLGFLKIAARPLVETDVPKPGVVVAKNNDTEMKNVETEKKHMNDWNKHDGTAVDMLESEDFVFHDLTAPNDLSKAQTTQVNRGFWKAFSDAKINPTSMWGADAYVSVTGTFDGTNDGELPAMQINKTGKKVSLPFVDIFRLDGGKIKEEWLFFDSASLLSQLGVK